MKEIGNIYLSWRIGASYRRHIIGVLKRSAQGVEFKYLPEGVRDAQKDGFTPYTEFQDLSKTYSVGVLETFGQRIIKSERTDKSTFYDFWEIKPSFQDNKYYLLAHTQGLLPTDNFEFLADYHPVKELCFISDLAGLSNLKIPSKTLKIGDQLTYKIERNNQFDKKAVMVFKESMLVGYIKKVHNSVFHKPKGDQLKITVKALDENGLTKRIFVKIHF